MGLLPREHGAYGQIAFPLIAAFAAAGVSTPGILIALAAVAGFLAHEPALILLGQRGRRASRELAPSASRWLIVWGLVGAAAGLAAILLLEAVARVALLVPLVPAALLGVAAVRGTEKSWQGETAAAAAFSGIAVPVAMAAGASWTAAAALAIPFALLFITSTLAVRSVILRVRGGGDPVGAATTRRAALSIAAGGGVLLALLVVREVLPPATLIGAAPGLATSAVLALRPPSPARLRRVGWTLVAVSVLTTALVVSRA